MKNINLKTIFTIFVTLLIGALLTAQTVAEAPANFHEENAGTEDNPYQIANLANLRWLSETPAVWGLIPGSLDIAPFHFIQTADIDATETENWNRGEEINREGFNSIGKGRLSDGSPANGFRGVYDGNGYTISNLFMVNKVWTSHEPVAYYGFFDYVVTATIKNVNLENIRFSSRGVASPLVGQATLSHILNCHVSTAPDFPITFPGYTNDRDDFNLNLHPTRIGGLVGATAGTIIENSSATVSILDDHNWSHTTIGGLVGSAFGFREWVPPSVDEDGNIVHGYWEYHYNIIRNNAFYGSITAFIAEELFNPNIPEYTFVNRKGGLAGMVNELTRIENNIIAPNGPMTNVFGLVGTVYGDEIRISNTFWNTESSEVEEAFAELDGSAIVVNVHGLASSSMKNAQTFIHAGFCFDTVWDIDPLKNNGYPFIHLRTSLVSENDKTIISKVEFSAYPNPFNPTTTISFTIVNDGFVSLDIFNIRGQKIKSLVSENKATGNHSVVWNGTDNSGQSVGSGIYFYRITTDNFTSTKKMILLK
jgi:hypothetical protein